MAYYRREWLTLWRAAVLLTRHTFALPWPATTYGAWHVLRANQLWAPVPRNDPGRARSAMERFYRLVARHHGESFDPARAAALEVEWWRLHRALHRDGSDSHRSRLIDALAALYSYIYGVPERGVRLAAQERVPAMDYSDRWVTAGCDSHSPLIAAERADLVRSYAALLAAVHIPVVGPHG